MIGLIGCRIRTDLSKILRIKSIIKSTSYQNLLLTDNGTFVALSSQAKRAGTMKIAVTDESRGKSLKLNFTIMLKKGDNAQQLSTVYNIDNLAEARFKFGVSSVQVNADGFRQHYTKTVTSIFLSLKKHAQAMDSTIKVQCQDVNNDIPNNSCHWLCPENWMEWQKIKENDLTLIGDDYYYSTSTVNLSVIKEKSFTAKNMYEDVDLTDFTLNTSDGSVSVHKAWLSTQSDVFKALLCQEWKETAEGHVKIDGVTLQTLQHLKQYMYLGTLPDDGLRSLLLLAMYYMMDELKSECISKLARTATSENLDDLLNFAAENKVPELTFAILEMTPREVVNGAYTLRKAKSVSENQL